MQMCQNQAIRYLKAIDDTDPTTLDIVTATQLWGCEILCNLQQYMYKYMQQYKSAQGCGVWGNTLYVYGIENVQRNKKCCLYPV